MYPRTIFLVTDGDVCDSKEVINQIKRNVNFGRVHSFGIGADVSSYLIKESAKAGRGKAYFL